MQNWSAFNSISIQYIIISQNFCYEKVKNTCAKQYFIWFHLIFVLMIVTAAHIAEILGGTLEGNGSAQITGPAKIEEGFEGAISFLSNPKYESFIYHTKASAVIVGKDFVPTQAVGCTLIRVDNVYESLSILLGHFNVSESGEKTVSNLAFVDPDAQIGKGCSIGNFAHIGKNAKIGNNCRIAEQVFIGNNVVIGDDCILYPGVRIYHDCVIGKQCVIHSNSVIGSDGFGFAPKEDGTYSKMPQIGNVVLEDQVEIGACTVIDRATMGSTVIEKGVKLDNLIQIAHNVKVGKNTVIAAQTGIAGSTSIGEHSIIGGQVGIVGHLKLADKLMIQAKSGVSANIHEVGKKLYGYPAIEYQKYLKSYAYFKNLDQIVDKIRSLEKEVDKLKQNQK